VRTVSLRLILFMNSTHCLWLLVVMCKLAWRYTFIDGCASH
jgi:hypothetical protein